jgi:hypothetical protein
MHPILLANRNGRSDDLMDNQMRGRFVVDVDSRFGRVLQARRVRTAKKRTP